MHGLYPAKAFPPVYTILLSFYFHASTKNNNIKNGQCTKPWQDLQTCLLMPDLSCLSVVSDTLSGTLCCPLPYLSVNTTAVETNGAQNIADLYTLLSFF